MKLRRPPSSVPGNRAFAVILMLGLLAYMSSFALHNTRNLAHLENELRQTEQAQVKRLNGPSDRAKAEKRTSNAQR